MLLHMSCLTGYIGANWTSDKDECKNTTGYAFLLGGRGISVLQESILNYFIHCGVRIHSLLLAVWRQFFLENSFNVYML